MSSGSATGALLGFLNERANQLKLQREALRAEQRRLTGLLTHLANQFDAPRFRQALNDFWALAAAATPTEMQRLLQTVVTRLDWGEDGTHRLALHELPTAPAKAAPEAANRGPSKPVPAFGRPGLVRHLYGERLPTSC